MKLKIVAQLLCSGPQLCSYLIQGKIKKIFLDYLFYAYNICSETFISMPILSYCTNIYNGRKDGQYFEAIQILVPQMFDKEEVFCAGDSIDSNSACFGDSGGPVIKFVASTNRNPYFQLVGNIQLFCSNFKEMAHFLFRFLIKRRH